MTKRKTWLAVILNFFSFGLGYLYVGRLKLALSLGALFLLGTIAIDYLAPLSFSMGVTCSCLMLIFHIWAFVHLAKLSKSNEPLKFFQKKRFYLAYALVFFGGAELLNYYDGSQAFLIPADSMSPALIKGDRIITELYTLKKRNLKKGDIVLFEQLGATQQKEVFVKRVAGTPGEKMNASKDPNNCVKLGSSGTTPVAELCPFVVPDKEYFLIGDNETNSYDSRSFGFIAEQDILGKARYIYFSRDPESGALRKDRIGQSLY